MMLLGRYCLHLSATLHHVFLAWLSCKISLFKFLLLYYWAKAEKIIQQGRFTGNKFHKFF